MRPFSVPFCIFGSFPVRPFPIPWTFARCGPRFEQALARYRDWKSNSADPAVIGDRARYTAARQGTRQRSPSMSSPTSNTRSSPTTRPGRGAGRRRDATPRCAAYAEEELAGCNAPAGAAQRGSKTSCCAEGEDFDSIIVEIRAGTGGDEAALFAGDLYAMYTHYARDQGWKVEDISFSPGEQGGYKEVVFSVTGDDVYQQLALRERRPPRPARAQDRDAGPHPHLGRDRGRHARAGRGAGRDQATQDIEWERMRPAAPAASTSTRPKAPSASGTRRARRTRWK